MFELIMRKGFLFYFLGYEGVGKSTHISLLTGYLQAKGSKVRIASIRSDAYFLDLIKQLMMKLGRKVRYRRPEGTYTELIDVNIVKRLGKPWILLNVVTVLPASLITVYVPIRLGRIVLADRYLLDTIIDVYGMAEQMELPKDSAVLKTALRVLLCFMPKNRQVILFKAPYETLLPRYLTRGSPAEPFSWFSFQSRFYPIFSHCFQAEEIDTSGSIVETQLKVRKIVENYCFS